MSQYKELANTLKNLTHNDMGFYAAVDEAIAILLSLEAQRPTVDEVMNLVRAYGLRCFEDYSPGIQSEQKNLRAAIEALAAPVAAQPPSQPVDPVHVINTAIDAMMRRDATIAGVLFDFMGWLTTRKERLCLSSADDASPAVTAITDFAKMRSLSLDNAMVTDWQSGAAQASKPLSDEPNMFWNHDDPESPYGSIGEFLNDEWCQTGLAVGDIRRVQRAIRLPDVMVRVIAVSDDGDIDYIVEPVGGIKERR